MLDSREETHTASATLEDPPRSLSAGETTKQLTPAKICSKTLPAITVKPTTIDMMRTKDMYTNNRIVNSPSMLLNFFSPVMLWYNHWKLVNDKKTSAIKA